MPLAPIAAGTRSFAMMVASFVAPLPLLWDLLLSVFAFQVSSASAKSSSVVVLTVCACGEPDGAETAQRAASPPSPAALPPLDWPHMYHVFAAAPVLAAPHWLGASGGRRGERSCVAELETPPIQPNPLCSSDCPAELPSPPFTISLQLLLAAPESALLRAESPTTADCRVFVTFVQLVAGVAIPSIVVHCIQAPGGGGAAPAAAQGAARVARASRMGHHPSRGSWQLAEWGAHTWSCLRRAAAEAEAGLHQLFDVLAGRAGGSRVLMATAWWLLLSLLWVAALALERSDGGLEAA